MKKKRKKIVMMTISTLVLILLFRIRTLLKIPLMINVTLTSALKASPMMLKLTALMTNMMKNILRLVIANYARKHTKIL